MRIARSWGVQTNLNTIAGVRVVNLVGVRLSKTNTGTMETETQKEN